MYENRRAFPSEMPHVYFWQKKQIKAKRRFRRNSLLRALVGLSKDPLPKKQAGGSPSISPPGWAGAAALATRPLHVLLPSPGRSSQLAGDSRFGESPRPAVESAQIERAGARDLPVREVTAALAGGGFTRRSPRSAGRSAPPSPFWMSHWRRLIAYRMEMAHQQLVSKCLFWKNMDGRVLSHWVKGGGIWMAFLQV